jgi:acyl carrier protein
MSELYSGLAEILEVDLTLIGPDYELLEDGPVSWDSLAVISTIALIDDIYSCTVDGEALSRCKKISDIELLISNAKKQ